MLIKIYTLYTTQSISSLRQVLTTDNLKMMHLFLGSMETFLLINYRINSLKYQSTTTFFLKK
jgi:hypothetical protein